MITNINLGLCHQRTTAGRAPYFVNYQINGEQKYTFFYLRFAAESFKQKLINQQSKQLTTI